LPHQALEKRSAFVEHPDYRVGFEPCAKRVRVIASGTALAETTRVRLMRETRNVPVYYFPREDLRLDLLERSDHTTFCPFKGDASYWTVRVNDRVEDNVVLGYEDPFQEVADLKGYVSFYPDRVEWQRG